VLQAKAEQAHAAAELAQSEAAITEARARTTQAEAQQRQAEASLGLARQNNDRNLRVFADNHGAISKSDIDATRSVLDSRQADMDAAKANLDAAKTGEISAQCARDSAAAQQKAAEAAVASAEAELQEAERQLARTTIAAPSDGVVGNKNVESGNRVQAGETLLALVEPDVWVVANYKETQLARMRPGQEVELSIDALPDEAVRGRVDSLAPASGAQFALLPADNATGNFTKVGQRVPVKIIFDAATQRRLADKLRPGLSCVVDVRVR
jgi:membrane fusion protein (multidrug efflux system)